jgi:hypothetical protein
MNYDVKKNSDNLEVPAFIHQTSVIISFILLPLTWHKETIQVCDPYHMTGIYKNLSHCYVVTWIKMQMISYFAMPSVWLV